MVAQIPWARGMKSDETDNNDQHQKDSRMNKFVALIAAAALALGLTSPVSAQTDFGTTALETAANSLSEGQWISFQTNDINAVLGANGASGCVFGYTDDIVWDPISRQLFFFGGDHNAPAHFLSYTEQTNTWQRLPREPWFKGQSSGADHGYDHNAIDPAGRAFFHRTFGSPYVYKYDITNGTWTQLPSFAQDISYVNGYAAVEYFPELQGIVFSSTAAIILEDVASQWRELSPDVPAGSYHNIAEYNPVHKVLVFGGGVGSNDLYKIDSAGNITALKKAPINLGIQETVFTVDPVSGEYLVFTKNNLK